ncbi:deoxyribonuclease IV [Blautia sp. MSJ-19]|uniref:deoxyribonuclease IV n=1 Tax=Blautia sp. MSJ-19 TaxID=2841517 RepID=UPI001C0F364B|nr:deoxyribonuclease IV [Blautia sp. MSJ-19]MBU5481881.1 deoxyribonuclease IV [Blautia sp. MSJ-19]
MTTLYIGNHTSSSKEYAAMGKQTVKNGGNTFAFFTRNPRGGKAKTIDETDIRKFLSLAEEEHFGKIVAHAPYTLNCCAGKEDLRIFARDTFADDLQRMEYTPGNYYNFHPGSHVGQGTEIGIQKIAEILNDVLTEEQTTTVLLETMSGKGTEMGRNFEELKEILNRIEKENKMGICMDTCHVWDGGYDIVHNLDGVLNEFDRIIGLSRLKAVHLNDSLNDLGSNKDRHARIGEGKIGLEALIRIIKHPALAGIPFILETPNDDAGWAEEIRILKEAFYH